MHDTKRLKYKEPFSIHYREWRSHARGVYPTQETSRITTARVKEEKEADTRIMQESNKKSGRKERGHEGEKSQTRPS